MRYFKIQLGTNPHVFDVLTIADDGTMSMDCRVCERLLHYDGLTMEHTPYGDRINYGKGSSMPWTDKKGNISARWSEVPCNDAITDVKAITNNIKGTTSQNVGTPEYSTPTKSETEAKANVEAEVPTVTDAAPAVEPAEQAQPEVCPAVFPQESQESQKQRQLHRSSSRSISDGQRQDIDPANNHHRTDEPTQPATARRKHFSLFTLHSSFLKPLAVAAASVVVCIVIYETGLLIPMGLIGLATSGLVK